MDFVGSHRWSEQGGTWSGVGSRKLTLAAVAGGPHIGVMANPWEGLEATGLSAGMCHAGAQWIGVPGELRGYAEAHRRHGRLPWAQLFQPTIALLRGGHVVAPVLSQFLHNGFLHLPCRRQRCG